MGKSIEAVKIYLMKRDKWLKGFTNVKMDTFIKAITLCEMKSVFEGFLPDQEM
jgi:hypothetical protein